MVKAWKHLPAELEKIKLRVGERQYKSIQRARRRKMLLDFDTVKQSYEDDPTKDFEVDLKGVQDSKENGIEDETIAISAYVFNFSPDLVLTFNVANLLLFFFMFCQEHHENCV